MKNLLSDYLDIFETYLIGLRDQLEASFTFEIDINNYSVVFKRNIIGLPPDRVLSIKYEFDKETIEHSNPSAELLKISLWTLRSTIMYSLLKFSDSFYRDRFEGKPIVSDEIVKVFDVKSNNIKTIRVDSIDWEQFFKV